MDISYSTDTLTARSGSKTTVRFMNNDAGVDHDLSFALPALPHGNTCRGPCDDEYTFVAPEPGSYVFFFCTVHAEMVGSFVVTP